jgi:hypothetical protein
LPAPKDDEAIVRFMSLFSKLRDMIDDDPIGLKLLTATDEKLRELCLGVENCAATLSTSERRRRQLFAAPVDPKFIKAWRVYEERYASELADVFFMDLLGMTLDDVGTAHPSPFEARWEAAALEGKELARAIDAALDFAHEQVSDDWRDFPEGFAEDIADGISAWGRLVHETEFDLKGVFRRRQLVPFVFIPRHVSSQYGEMEHLSLLTHLQQAHEAFVFGTPFAAIALMRSILEVVLERHYGADPGAELGAQINSAHNLPANAPKAALHRLRHLANDILHFNNDRVQLPTDMERTVLQLLHVLRALIEGAPARPLG